MKIGTISLVYENKLNQWSEKHIHREENNYQFYFVLFGVFLDIDKLVDFNLSGLFYKTPFVI